MSSVKTHKLAQVPWLKIIIFGFFLLMALRFMPYRIVVDPKVTQAVFEDKQTYYSMKTLVVKGLSLGGVLAAMCYQKRPTEAPVVVERRHLEVIAASMKKLARKKAIHLEWRVQDRNRVFIGFEVFTGEPVYLDGEDLFKGLLVLGSPGTGKTARTYKTILRQLEMDPRTASIYFTLKGKDKQFFEGMLTGMGKPFIALEEVNLLELSMHPQLGLLKDLTAAMVAAGLDAVRLATKDAFWAYAAANAIAEHLLALEPKERSFGKALERLRSVAIQTDNRTALSYAESLLPVLQPLESATAAALRFNRRSGLCKGPLFLKAHRSARLIVNGRCETIEAGAKGLYHEHLQDQNAFYEVASEDLEGVPWEMLLEGKSVLLPASNNTLPFNFGIAVIKQSFLQWLQREAAAEKSRVLIRDPQKRFRFVLAQDEGHNFLNLGKMGISDQKALQENREAGLVHLVCTQNLQALKVNGSEDFLGNVNTIVAFKVSPATMEDTLKLFGKFEIDKRRISLSEGVHRADRKLQTTQALDEIKATFIDPSVWRELPEGVAVVGSSNQAPKLVFCPYHDRIRIRS